MVSLTTLKRFIARFRYPASLPEDVGSDLGIDISNLIAFDDFLRTLTTPTLNPKRLKKFMSREQAEAAFKSALIKERFLRDTLFSYYFNEGYIEFVLQFDQDSRLRRVYLHHKLIDVDGGIEIPLN